MAQDGLAEPQGHPVAVQRPWRRSRGLPLLKCLFSLWCRQTCPSGSIPEPSTPSEHTLGFQSSNRSLGALGSSLTASAGDASGVCCTRDRAGRGASPQWPGQPQAVAYYSSQCENRLTRPVGERADLQGKGLSRELVISPSQRLKGSAGKFGP